MSPPDGTTGHGPLVESLDARDPAIAAEILAVMHASYAVEAALLGVADFFPLGRTIGQVRTAPCTFHGVREAGRLLAVVEVDEHSAERPNVDALVVHPDAFRRGFGTALMRHVMARCGSRGLTVSTGERNAPAIALYERLGFAIERRWRTDDGIAMVTLGLAPRA